MDHSYLIVVSGMPLTELVAGRLAVDFHQKDCLQILLEMALQILRILLVVIL